MGKSDKTKEIMNITSKAATKLKEKTNDTMDYFKATPEEWVMRAAKLPIAKVNRTTFLRKELKKYCSTDVVDLAIAKNPAYAGVKREIIDKISRDVINYETKKVSSISFAAGIPGGAAMAAAVPIDVAQYFAFTLRVTQELAYLYGFEEFNLNEECIDAETMNVLLVFLGTMFGVQGANKGVLVLARSASIQLAKDIAKKPLTKGAIYPVVKSIARTVGVKMTKTVFAESVSKAVPVLGGIVSGGLTYASFKPNCNRLMKTLQESNLCDTDFYKDVKDGKLNTDELELEIIDVEDIETN